MFHFCISHGITMVKAAKPGSMKPDPLLMIFLGNTCKVWEKSAMQFETLGMRVVILRTGIVLAKEDGAVKPMALSVKLFAGAAFGDGEQYMPWIHLDDLCREYEFAISNQSLHGAYNAVAPSPVKNSFFVKTLGKVLHRPIWPINIPGFVLKTILGEKAVVVLQGQRVTNEKDQTGRVCFQV
jgi:uncharacterized protein (TIGR01777 family)